ncbi:MAG: dihydrolipoyl dehydrogenase [Coriobacteriia bacterium]|nr:dihydrolipoyl dehydrogenase [Coriobacteriia bacterium]
MPKISVIGGGPGGYAAAFEAAAAGAEVTLFESARLGGTCLNAGCIPAKTVLRSAHALREVARGADFALTGLPDAACVRVDPGALRGRKEGVVDELVDQLEATAKRLKVTVVQGQARLVAPTTVAVAAAAETASNTPSAPLATYDSDAVIIATGSEPVVLPALSQPFVWTSDDALALREIPREIIIVGGGVIGVEFACAYAAFGSTVHIVELAPTLLPGFDARVVRMLTASLQQQGVQLHLGTSVETARQQERDDKNTPGVILSGVGPAARSRVIAVLSDGTELAADVLMSAVGRAPRTAGLGADALGLARDRRALKVDEHLQTNVPGVFAVGDAIGGMMLAHAAEAEGRAAARNALAQLAGRTPTQTVNYRAIPACVYTFPEVAAVGLHSAAAKEAGYAPVSGLVKYAGNGKALAEGESEGYVELIADRATGELLGCQIVGAHAVELIAIAAEALAAQMTVADFRRTVFAHPTVSELLHAAAEAAAAKLDDKTGPVPLSPTKGEVSAR